MMQAGSSGAAMRLLHHVCTDGTDGQAPPAIRKLPVRRGLVSSVVQEVAALHMPPLPRICRVTRTQRGYVLVWQHDLIVIARVAELEFRQASDRAGGTAWGEVQCGTRRPR